MLSYHFIILALIVGCVFGFLVSSRERNRLKEASQKVIDLQNELVKTKKELEDVTREYHQKYDPYSSKMTKSIILTMDETGTILSMNDYGLQFFGYDNIDELKGRNIIGTLCAETDKEGHEMDNLIDRIRNNPRLFTDNENENICKNGERKWISWTNRIVYNDAGEPQEIRSVGFDITPRKRLEEELRQIMVLDPVTGVLNRHKFLEEGIREVKRARRYDRSLSVIFMSVGHFQTHDELGPTFTDEVLKKAVQACQAETRDSDSLGRLADVEFAVLLPETTIDGAKTVAQRILQNIVSTPIVVADTSVTIDVRIGVASLTEKDATVDDIIQRAFMAIRNGNDDENTISVA